MKVVKSYTVKTYSKTTNDSPISVSRILTGVIAGNVLLALYGVIVVLHP